jgi:hypothetical protein
MKVTMQRGIRNMMSLLHRRFRTHQTHLSYPHLHTTVYSDTLLSDIPSVRGNVCAQLFVTDKDFFRVYPMKAKSEAYVKLNQNG